MRTARVIRSGLFIQVEFEDIAKDDRFQLFEPDGTFVCEAIALTDAKPCDPPGNWTVDARRVQPTRETLAAKPAEKPKDVG